MRRSAAIAISSPIWCGGCWRTAPIRPSSRSRPIRACRSPRSCNGRRASIADAVAARHPKIPLPRDLYGRCAETRPASSSATARASTRCLPRVRRDAARTGGRAADRRRRRRGASAPAESPIDGEEIGEVVEGDEAIVTPRWRRRPPDLPHGPRRRSRPAPRSDAGGRSAGEHRARLIALLQREGGKTLDDAVAEVREAADFCRYYARERARARAATMPGPTGETNELRWRGRGVFVCISPWNFPLAIFTGQVAAALAAGNTVVAKPAEQTPLVAARRCAAARRRRSGGRAASRSRRRRVGALLVGDRTSPASPSPARPRWRGRSTARSPRRMPRSCR